MPAGLFSRISNRLLAACLSLFMAGAALAQTPAAPNIDWPAYNGNRNGDHASPLSQINRTNVAQLKVAWQFDTGEKGDIQTNPLIIGRVLYACTPSDKIIALDAATGRLLWKFDSTIDSHDRTIGGASQPSRGLAYWTDGREARIFAGVLNYLYALDARTGRPIPSFGRIDLRKGLREPYEQQSIALTTPGLVYKDLIIVGGRNPETHPAPPGDVRAFDVRTGDLRWTFHTIPRPGEYRYNTWPPDAYKSAGAANNWAGMTLDAQRGIVYVPTGSAVFDFYGGDRIGNDLFADSLLALDAATGRRLWYFQGVHHDIWDRDFPAPPALVTIDRNGQRIDAVAQTTKQGVVYLFDRVTGAPLFPIEEHRYPSSSVPGEKTSPTQPMPTAPAPYARQRLTADLLTTRTPAAHQWALDTFRTFRSDGQFVPFSLDRQTIVFPGFDGGAEWGGPAVDPATGVLYVNANEMAWTGGLVADNPAAGPGPALYRNQCGVCHGVNRAGNPPAFPSLIGVAHRLTGAQIRDVIAHGKNRMPGFPNLQPTQVDALLAYLKTAAIPAPEHTHSLMSGGPHATYSFTGYRKFLDPDGYPAIAPPWGTLSAIDLNTGKFLWHIPLGEYPALAAQGLTNTGSENYGGPIVTAGGLVFIGATVYDRKFRAFDSSTGKLLWETTLPFAGIATPATYAIDSRQYVVIAASGGRDPKSPVGGMYIAFSLP
ncbi:MAG TPA: PQQ-binding-like beta-propeller repeat protein [Acidobacteriaceae bacterium]|jgi:quinoprotein glucose dehydrogenase|nr:PQQ-binding-like beta-propeller repeat protein [Acidobacteriaceae bacterium]